MTDKTWGSMPTPTSFNTSHYRPCRIDFDNIDLQQRSTEAPVQTLSLSLSLSPGLIYDGWTPSALNLEHT